ncbi:hypothetical protein CCACVL1_25382 [Corchorus capsularis]|uniref:Bulb-type lectin domain-containing protein n=1 Tax=Corchorus capsularis TaxID=210143 RepID=A0A1R3GL02_COCAP|nr:hypothetical protein CCACVL1_25382 [Corchorus capsularis]
MGIISPLMLLVLHFSCNTFYIGTALDTITPSKSIKDPETIASSSEAFKLGFFSPANSTNRYVGIWYTKGIPKESLIWVANRDKPLKDESGVVTISKDGNLVVLNGQKELLCSSNVKNPVTNASAQLLDSGNLVLQDINSTDGVRLWESFQQPSNAFVPTMKIRTNVRTGEKVQLTSWKGSSGPSNGSFSIGLGTLSIAQIFIWNNTMPYWRSGPWNGQNFLGNVIILSFLMESIWWMIKKVVFTLPLGLQTSLLSHIFSWTHKENLLDEFGMMGKGIGTFGGLLRKLSVIFMVKCGAFGSCKPSKPSICSCLRGFVLVFHGHKRR